MTTSTQYPKMVMIIRHGEKPGDLGSDKDGGPHLSILGSARAAALPSLFTSDPTASPIQGLHQLACELAVDKPHGSFTGIYDSGTAQGGQARFPTPDFLFATKSDEGSHRPFETIKPLEEALRCFNNPGLQINHTFENSKHGKDGQHGYKDLVEAEILKKTIYADKVILICWHHGKILDLLKAFKVPSNQWPWDQWPATVFDLIFCITWGQGQAKLAVGHQMLLNGDSCDLKFTSGSVTLTLDAPNTLPAPDDRALPKNFRSMNHLSVGGNHASGSAQFSPAQLQNMISQKQVLSPLTVVDLRQESHGFLTLRDSSEVAVSWFVERDWINVAKEFVSIQADEVQRLQEAASSQVLPVYSIQEKTDEDGICIADEFAVSPGGSYNTEATLLQALDIGYVRLPTTDHCRPRDSEVDRFITFETNLKAGTWLHFHCRAGDGRTTTFMVMHDIFYNALDETLDEILNRQGPNKKPNHGLGGVDLSKTDKSKDQTKSRYDYPFMEERWVFVQNFYTYVRQFKPGGFSVTWSQWASQNAART